jgi:hypothetical protein
MKTLSIRTAGGLLLIGTFLAAQEAVPRRPNYTDPTYGFSLTAPAFPKDGPGQPAIPVLISGPTVDGFASNVNVNIQQIATTRQGYLDLSLGQMRQVGFKINSNREVTVSGKDAIRLDYEGKLGGNDLRFLALAVIEKDRVILVTCTALKASFKAIEPEFTACLDSFRLN